jgi:polyphosphate kinase
MSEIKLSYYQRNKERIREYYQKYYQENKLKILQKRKSSQERKEWFKNYYQTKGAKNNQPIIINKDKQPNTFKKIVDKIVVTFT